MSTSPSAGPLSATVMARLGRIAHEVAAEWGVQLGAPLGLARYSYVAPAGEKYVLKVTPVEDDEADHEGDALASWNGDGAVRLVRRNRERRALLLERARPGIDASTLPETEATAIAMEVGRRLWRRVEPGEPFRQIADRVPSAAASGPSAASLPSLPPDLIR